MKAVFSVLTLIFYCFQIQAVNWNPTQNLSVPGENAVNAQIGVSSSGYAVGVWQSFDGTNTVIESANLPFKGSWSAVSELSADGEDAANAEVAVDPDNNAVAVWERFDGSEWIIQASTLAFGGSWQTPSNVSATGQNAHFPQVATDVDGNAYAVWQAFDGANTRIQTATLPKGGSWSISNLSVAGQNAVLPQIAAGASGEAVSVWVRSNGSNTIVQTSSLAGGVWSVPFDLSALGQNASSPEIAFNENGDGVAIWLRSDGANTIVQASTLSGGVWSSAVNLSQAGQNAFSPQVKMNASGNAVAVWTWSNGTKTVIQAATFLNGVWDSAENLSDGNQNSFNPQVAIDVNSNAVALWRTFNGANTLIESAQFFILTQSWVSYPNLSATGQNALSPILASDLNGNTVALWQFFDGSNFLIQGVSGLALAAPPNIRWQQKVIRYLGQGDLVNAIDWDLPDQPGIFFRIYRGDLSHLVQSSNGNHFEDHQIDLGEHRSYFITTVDYLNNESDPQRIDIP